MTDSPSILPHLCLCISDGASEPFLPEALPALPRVSEPSNCPPQTSHILWWGEEGLALGPVHQPYTQATRVDFADPGLLHRLRTSGKRQGIGKAAGLDKAKHVLQVLDATAGLGRDSCVLAHLGCEVTMMERSPWIHALLEDGLRRARESNEPLVQRAVSRMRLVRGDARDQLRSFAARGESVDVVYLDPMFPPRRKSAAVKKDIGVLQGLLGPDEDLEELLQLALAAARRRVVVKRPPDQREIPGPSPTFVLSGKAAHFSIYVNGGMNDAAD